MWAYDIYCDYEWVRQCNGHIGSLSFTVNARAGIINDKLEILLFADNRALRHVRVILHTDDQQLAQECINANINLWIDSIETAVILHIRQSYSIPRLAGTGLYATVLSEYQGGEHIATEISLSSPQILFDPRIVGDSFALWNIDMRLHLFYCRRMIDPNILLDQRWLYGYKLFEFHFVRQKLGPEKSAKNGKHDLPKNAQWRDYLERYRTQLESFANTSQPKDNQLFGLIERVRNMTAHAFVDDRPLQERQKQPLNLLELTFPIMLSMANDLINSLANKNVPVKLKTLYFGINTTQNSQNG